MSDWTAIRAAISQWKEERAKKPIYQYIKSDEWGKKYGYTLQPPYTEEELAESEKLAQYTLPHDFRNYLKHVSREIVFDSYPCTFSLPKTPFEPCKIKEDIEFICPYELEEFDISSNYRKVFNPDAEDSEDEGYIDGYEGTVLIGDGGCAFFTTIVISHGPHYGEIWGGDNESRSLHKKSFLDWMLDWMERYSILKKNTS